MYSCFLFFVLPPSSRSARSDTLCPETTFFRSAFVLAVEGHGQIGQQALTYTDRAGTGAADAMGGGEGFVQVHVDDVEAHVTGTHFAEDGVEVRTIVVEQAAGAVNGFGDGFDLPFEDAARGRVGDRKCGV